MILPASVGAISRHVPPLLIAVVGSCVLGAGTVGLVNIPPVLIPISGSIQMSSGTVGLENIPPVLVTVSGSLPMSVGTVDLQAIEQATIIINGTLPMSDGTVGVTVDAIFDITGALTMSSGTVGLVAIDPATITISGALTMSDGTVGLQAATALNSSAFSGGYFTVPNITSIGSENTASIWFKPTSSPTEACIFNIANTSNSVALAIYQSGGTANQIIFQWRYGVGGASARTITSDTMSVGTWYHLTLASDSGGTKGYINGVEKTSYADAMASGSIDIFNIGRLSAGGGHYAAGSAAMFAMHSRKLSGSEITELYNSGIALEYNAMSSGLKTNLLTAIRLANWSGSGSTEIADQSGNSNPAVNNGSVPFTGTGLSAQV